MNTVGITIIVIILVPVLFQVVVLSIRQKQRHEEIKQTLTRIENKLDQ